MAEKEIALLKQQIERLDDKRFDLSAWKNRTILFLERIFGNNSPKLKMISELHYDYSSWSLRDTAAGGSAKDKDPVRIQAKDILEATITELEMLGLPKEKEEQYKLKELLEDELTGRQMKEIVLILHSDKTNKAEEIKNILESLPGEKLAAIMANLLTA
ncbi:MAG: hypothetical protein ACOC0R_03485 [Mariniphaga sp.]